MIAHSKPYITSKDYSAIDAQLKTGMLAEGSTNKLFEKKVAEYLNVKYCISASSGVSALHLALSALQIKKSDEVIIPSYACESVYKIIKNYGAIPILCDIGDTWVMTPKTVSAVLTKKTKAIVLVNIFGIDGWHNDFKKLGLPIIEDNCQAFGYEKNEKLSKLRGEIGIFSFHATKCLATGEGGMFATNKTELYKIASSKKEDHDPFCRMTDLQAALGISQLQQYADMKHRRKQIAEKYFNGLPKALLSNMNLVKNNSIYFRFLLTVTDRSIDECISHFAKKNISVRRGVDALLHHTYGGSNTNFSNTEKTYKNTLSIPIYPALASKEVDHIIKELNIFFDGPKR